MGLGGRRSDARRKKKESITVKADDIPRLKVIREGAKCKDNEELLRWLLSLAEKYLGVDSKGNAKRFSDVATKDNTGEEGSKERLDETRFGETSRRDEDDDGDEGSSRVGVGTDIVSDAARMIREDLEKEGGDLSIAAEDGTSLQVHVIGGDSDLVLMPGEGQSQGDGDWTEDSASPVKISSEKLSDIKLKPRRSRRIHHAKEGGFKCGQCPFRYPTKEAAELHEATHGCKVQICEKCNKEFSSIEALRSHYRFVHDKKYDCTMCDKKFGTKYLLMQHMRTHTGEKPFVCEKCDKGFTTSSSLKAHLESHNISRSYLCHECGAAYRRRDCLKQHILRRHKMSDEFQCEMCGKQFKYRESLKNHLEHHKNKDEGKAPYQCHLCGKGYTMAVTLQRHMSTHKTVFRCETCNREFSHRHHLKRHLIVHTGERPFVCVHCDRTFGLRTTLLTHLRLHTGEKPYKCHQCPVAFRRNYSLKNHLKKVHGFEVPARIPGSFPLKVSHQDNVPQEVLMELQLQQDETVGQAMRTDKELMSNSVPIQLTLHQIESDANVETTMQQAVAFGANAESAVTANDLIDNADSQQAVLTLANMSHQLMNVQQMEELQVQEQVQQVQQQVQEVHIQQISDGSQTMEYVTIPVNFTSLPTSEVETQVAQLFTKQ